MMGGYGMFDGMGGIFMFVWWIILIIGIVALVKWLGKPYSASRDAGNKALDILKERYARGEITAQEFQKIKQDLS